MRNVSVSPLLSRRLDSLAFCSLYPFGIRLASRKAEKNSLLALAPFN